MCSAGSLISSATDRTSWIRRSLSRSAAEDDREFSSENPRCFGSKSTLLRGSGQSWIRTSEGVSQRIYSPPRLTTSVSTLLVRSGVLIRAARAAQEFRGKKLRPSQVSPRHYHGHNRRQIGFFTGTVAGCGATPGFDAAGTESPVTFSRATMLTFFSRMRSMG